LIRATAELHELAGELEAAERALRAGDYSDLPLARRLRSGRRPVALEAEVEAARRRLTQRQEETGPRRVRTEELERAAEEPPGRVDTATVYRIHSARHHLTWSARRYQRLARRQRSEPVLLARKGGLAWWWYLDRFWWADASVGARALEASVLTGDYASQRQRASLERARAGLVGRSGALSVQDFVPDQIRREVWLRDHGRCVDCGTLTGLAFDHILPLAAGGSNMAQNLELRCQPCQTRRRTNEARATVGKARIRVHAEREWGVSLTETTWPRAS
jgi:hypothetical protein